MRTSPIFITAAFAAAILALSAGTAAADPNRYQPQNKLAEVSADPRDGSDVIQLPQGDFDYLELRGTGAPIFLRDVAIEFADGRVIHSGSRGIVVPGQGRVVELPARHAPITAIVADYGPRRTNRTPARLEVFGVPRCDDSRFEPSTRFGDASSYPSYDRRSTWRSR